MWVRHDERALFRSNPSAIFIDFTANTNAEKLPFFMGTGLTVSNEGVVMFRALTPNEKLRWTDTIMTKGLPLLLGRDTFSKCRIGLGDECGNEIKSWQKAGAARSHSAVYRLCGLHKIHFGIYERGACATCAFYVPRAARSPFATFILFLSMAGLANMFVNKKDGAAIVRQFADFHVWFCKECESPAEEAFGRAALREFLTTQKLIDAGDPLFCYCVLRIQSACKQI